MASVAWAAMSSNAAMTARSPADAPSGVSPFERTTRTTPAGGPEAPPAGGDACPMAGAMAGAMHQPSILTHIIIH